MAKTKYTEEDIKTLEWREHIRLRPGMYIGKRGDGSAPDDGIYVLLKEVIDNCIDEFVMGHGKVIEVKLDGDSISVRDFGRGIPLGKLMDCAAKINTGAKYDSEAFQKSVGLNGVGIKAVNALSESFQVQAFREGKTKSITFSKAEVINEIEFGAVNNPTAHVNITNDITLGFISFNNSGIIPKSNEGFFNLVNAVDIALLI